jgi:hypothetical protein
MWPTGVAGRGSSRSTPQIEEGIPMPHFPWMAITALRLAGSLTPADPRACGKPSVHSLAAYVAAQKDAR